MMLSQAVGSWYQSTGLECVIVSKITKCIIKVDYIQCVIVIGNNYFSINKKTLIVPNKKKNTENIIIAETTFFIIILGYIYNNII